jgi:hypothetical protein
MDFIGDIDLVGLLSVVIFYLLILGVGMWAAGKKSHVEGVSEEVSIKIFNLSFTSWSGEGIGEEGSIKILNPSFTSYFWGWACGHVGSRQEEPR